MRSSIDLREQYTAIGNISFGTNYSSFVELHNPFKAPKLSGKNEEILSADNRVLTFIGSA